MSPSSTPRNPESDETVRRRDDWLADPAGFLRRALFWILVPAAVLAVSAFVYVYFLAVPLYQARASVILSPGSSEGISLPMEGYLRIAKSRRLMELVQAAVGSGEGEASPPLETGRLSTRVIVPERTEPGRVLLLELTAENEDPERAARIANAWARSLIALDDRLQRVVALTRVEAELDESLDRIVERQDTLQEDLADLLAVRSETPEFFELETTVTGREILRDGGNERLVSQHTNPVYLELTKRILETEMDLRRLDSQLEPTVRGLELARSIRESVGADRNSPAAALPERSWSELTQLSTSTGEDKVPNLKLRRALQAEGNARLFDLARPSKEPANGKRVLQVIAATLAGLVLGFALAVGREVLRGG
jgi:capsular polysaccharide biosynthesis protein